MRFCTNCGSQLQEAAKFCSRCGTMINDQIKNDARKNSGSAIKPLVCDLCGSNNVIKQDGLFVCQHCGTKYSIKEAQRMILEGSIDVKGTVSIDHSAELKNLLQLARRARMENNAENAHKYYEQILIKDPANWEAYYYSVYFQSMCTSIAGIESAAARLSNSLRTVFQLIKNNSVNQTEQHQKVSEIAQTCISIAKLFIIAARNHYYGLSEDIRGRYSQEYANRCYATRNLLYSCAGLIEQEFGDIEAKESSVSCWEIGIGINQMLLPVLRNKNANKKEILLYVKKIQKYKPSYRLPKYWSNILS